MSRQPSFGTAPAFPSRFDFVERQLERTLERIVSQHMLVREQRLRSTPRGRIRFTAVDGGAAA